ncbi:MAG: S41 family peptidase [Vicinamibacterales bacterium]
MVTRTGRLSVQLLAGWMCVSALPLAAREQPLPQARELVAKYVEAIGGEAAWRTVNSMHARGRMSLPAQNMQGTFEILSARPDRALLRVDLAGLGKLETGFDGTVAWTIDPMTGPSLPKGEQLAEMKNDAQFDSVLHPPELVASMTTTERTQFDGRAAYKVAVKYVTGQSRDEFFDVETGLLLGMEGRTHTDMGSLPVRNVLRDYKQYGPIKQPSVLVQASMGIEQHFSVETIEINTLKDDAFALPAVIKAIIKTPADEPWKRDALAAFDETWTTIRDSFYDPTFGGLDWDDVRRRLRPAVETASSPQDARDAIRRMLATLDRSHFVLLSAETSPGDEPAPAGDAMVPVDVRLVGSDVVVTRLTERLADTALLPGDHILAIDNHIVDTTQGAVEVDPRIHARNVWQRVMRRLQGPAGSGVQVRVKRAGTEQAITARRVRPQGQSVTLGDLPSLHVRVEDRAVETSGGRAVGVIGFNVWLAQANEQLSAAVDQHRGKAGLVIDLRGNPGGLAVMIRGVAGHLFSSPVSLGRMTTRDSELEFPANPRVVMPDGRRVEPFGGPVALLVDELTASASECFAGGLQSLGRARVFGRTTAGQALPASTKRLPTGDVLMYAIADFVTATGTRLEGVGVVPDEPVVLDPATLAAGRDPDLDAALRWIEAEVAKSPEMLLSSSDLLERLMYTL